MKIGIWGQIQGQTELVRMAGPVFRTDPWPAGKKKSCLGIENQRGKKFPLPLILKAPWASLVVQMIKNLPAMQETWV